jgi:DNA-directed RNA polymerase specialized sigma24 family protein
VIQLHYIIEEDDAMNFEEYIRKVYTIAFRLTGDETSAKDVASLAIDKNANIVKENIDSNILHITIKEVCGIFLTDYVKFSSESFYNKNNTHIQNKLMNLEPLSRTAVVWKDIMGYSMKDLETISNCPKSELYKKLNKARKNLIHF